jgi:hypothetical protein
VTHSKLTEVGTGDPEFSPDVNFEAQDDTMEEVDNIEEVGAQNEKEAGSKVAESIERTLHKHVSLDCMGPQVSLEDFELSPKGNPEEVQIDAEVWA